MFGGKFAVPGVDIWKNLPSPEQMQQAQQDFSIATAAIAKYSAELANAGVVNETVKPKIQAVGQAVKEQAIWNGELGESWVSMGHQFQSGTDEIVDAITRIQPELLDFNYAVEEAIDRMERWNYVMGAVGEVAAAAADAGIISQKRFYQIQQVLLAIQATQRGMYEIAEAAAAYARYDVGAGAMHTAAAYLYFAVAAFRGWLP